MKYEIQMTSDYIFKYMYNPMRNTNLATLVFHSATKLTKIFNIYHSIFLSIGCNRDFHILLVDVKIIKSFYN